MPRRSLRPSHRRTDEYQLVRDALSGILVPASRIVRSDVEGLRGLEIGDQFAFDRRARVSPSYEDLRGITPAVQKYDPIAVSGGEGGFPYEEEEWLPTDLDGLEGWYDQDGLAAIGDGNTMETWPDLSGEDKDLAQATASARPTVQQVGADSVLDPIWEAQFDGTNDVMESEWGAEAVQTVVLGCTWRFLTEPSATLYTICLTDNLFGNSSLVTVTTSGLLSANSGASLHPPLGTTTHYSVAVFSSAASYLRLDGREVQRGTGTVDAGRTALAQNVVGGGAYANIGVRALVVANELPSDEEILLLESYLRYRARS
jgi:hypothetical protein